MPELSEILAVDDIALQIAQQGAMRSSAWPDLISPAAEYFARQEADMLGSVKAFVDEQNRQQAEMLRSLVMSTGALSFGSQMQAAIDEMNNPIRQIASQVEASLSWNGAIKDAIANLGLASPFLLPERRPAHRPVPKPEPEPPAAQIEVVEIANSDWREVIDQLIREGKATTKQLLQYLRPPKARRANSPSPEDIEAARELYESKKGIWPIERICEKLDISKATLYRWLDLK